MSALQPPHINTVDPGAHELSSEDEHFSSASEGDTPHGHARAPSTPITRVERVDNQPTHGEVPGTDAYNLRAQDAVPDEVEIVPDGQRSRSGTRSRALSGISQEGAERPSTPGGTPIPKTIVERVDDKPAHGEVEGTFARELRLADAEPDEVRRAPDITVDGGVHEGREDDQPVEDEVQQQAWLHSVWETKQDETMLEPGQEEDEAEEDDGFGDDFDEFNEGGGDDDFGDFDEADEAETVDQQTEEAPKHIQPTTPDLLAGLPPLNLSNLTRRQRQEAITPYLTAIFPTKMQPIENHDLPTISPNTTSPFLSDRSASLWQQLVSAPPMQPPNWTRSRIRRMFLVSLGVPVNLDEILPPSKQKRLVLPNINLPSLSPRPSTTLDRLKDGTAAANDSTTSLDSKSNPKRSTKRVQSSKGALPVPDFDLNAAALVCSTTEQAMSVFEDDELRQHVAKLQSMNEEASGVLEYWLKRKDEGVKEKEALEGVIENLVGFVKGRRGK
ncbi:hypothetical protein LTR62_007039 [Meristemomyces frigidus]|uniref:Uncharacterized protein n=1 Tax=Meristemomyces frigidus TaxID=1508187 RepID=A0AAN7TJA5_9PEZI|nr:hypothetical protein LTR62_007039 [Meristemomyces frigidus]